jgi:hypothetical protein
MRGASKQIGDYRKLRPGGELTATNRNSKKTLDWRLLSQCGTEQSMKSETKVEVPLHENKSWD